MLSAEGARLLRRIEELGLDDHPVSTLQHARERSRAELALKLAPAAVASVAHERVRGEGGEIGVRVYVPFGRRPFPAMVFIHGGGWVVGSVEHSDSECRDLCRACQALVISVGYRLAPEAKFPAGLEDCMTALRWTAENAARFGGDPARIIVAGESSGANLAAAVALVASDQAGPAIALQILIYPVTDSRRDTQSYRDYADGFGLTRRDMEWYWSLYLERASDADDPRASVLRARDLGGLPPTLLLTAECDVLRDEGEAYGQRLRDAGVAVRSRRYRGLIHGFWECGGVIETPALATAEIGRAVGAIA